MRKNEKSRVLVGRCKKCRKPKIRYTTFSLLPAIIIKTKRKSSDRCHVASVAIV